MTFDKHTDSSTLPSISNLFFFKCDLNTPEVFSFFMVFPLPNPMRCDVELLVKFVCFSRLDGRQVGAAAFL